MKQTEEDNSPLHRYNEPKAICLNEKNKINILDFKLKARQTIDTSVQIKNKHFLLLLTIEQTLSALQLTPKPIQTILFATG